MLSFYLASIQKSFLTFYLAYVQARSSASGAFNLLGNELAEE
jgi:hypothetical protein